MARLVIEPVGLHWLYADEPSDLCAHGGLRVTLNGRIVFEAGTQDDGYALSTGALHLLRTIERDYAPGESSSGQLVPCCGHFMVFDADLAEVVNVPCPNGIEWRIQHENKQANVYLLDGGVLTVSDGEWRASVRDFSDSVRRFYNSPPARAPSDDVNHEWHGRFVEEWNRRHEAAR